MSMSLEDVLGEAKAAISEYLDKLVTFKVKWNVSEFLGKFESALAKVVQGLVDGHFDKSALEKVLCILNEWYDTYYTIHSEMDNMFSDFMSDLDDISTEMDGIEDE